MFLTLSNREIARNPREKSVGGIVLVEGSLRTSQSLRKERDGNYPVAGLRSRGEMGWLLKGKLGLES